MTDGKLDVSVVICAYTERRWDTLVAAVKSIQQQSVSACEIIVVIDHNQRLLERVNAQLARVVVVENKGPQGLSGARNSGVALARGALIAFLDDDARAESGWLERLTRCFDDPQVLGVGGTVEPEWVDKRPAWFPGEFYWVVGCTYCDQPDRPVVVRNPYGGCACYRREIFDVVGGFRTDMGRKGTLPLGCEETELCVRANQCWPRKCFLYEPLATVYHCIPPVRARWRYFGSRCFAEGLSKAAMTRYVGTRDGLAAERTYVYQTLPRGILCGIGDVLYRFDLSGLLRSGAIIAGLMLTLSGYLSGRVRHFLRMERSLPPPWPTRGSCCE